MIKYQQQNKTRCAADVMSVAAAQKHKTNSLPLDLESTQGLPEIGARLSQRVAMDDLASYFVEERSKVR